MLQQGITRDMFLVSCNPSYHQIRHLVITGFAELGRSNEPIKSFDHLNTELVRYSEFRIPTVDKVWIFYIIQLDNTSQSTWMSLVIVIKK